MSVHRDWALLKAMRLDDQATVIVAYLYGILDVGLDRRPLASYALVGVGLFLVSVASFVLNEFADKEIDRERSDRHGSDISGATTAWVVLLLSAAGLLTGALGGAPLCIGGALLAGILYSLPWPHLKTRYGFDLICLALCFVFFPYSAPREILAYTVGISLPAFSILNVALLLSFLAACNLIAMIRDIDSDREAGIRNTTVRIGLQNSLRLGVSLTVVTSLLGTILVSSQSSYWYYPILLASPCVAFTFGFGLGAHPDGKKVHAYFASRAREGIAVGNALAALLLFLMGFLAR